MKKISVALIAILLIGSVCGCASQKQVQSQSLPSQPPAVKVEKPANESYSVVAGDTLWGISGKFYEDSFQWPLIYKSNRDQIQDPDLIYPKQNFRVDKGFDAQDIQKARTVAGNTPKYVPHSKPRSALPVDYF